MWAKAFGVWVTVSGLDALRKHVKKVGAKYPVALDQNGGENHRKYLRRPAFAIAYLIGRDGRVVWQGFTGWGNKLETKHERRIRKELVKAAPDRK